MRLHIQKLFFPVLLAVFAIGVSSCKNEKDEPLPSFSEKSFTDTDLLLYYQGNQMPGKTANVKISGNKAEIRFNSVLDLSQISGLGLTEKLVCPGVLPGNKVLKLTVPLEVADGKYIFAGSGETPEVSYKYDGTISENLLTFNFKDCELINQSLAGLVLTPSPIERDGLHITSLPFHLVWELDPSEGIDLPLTDILKGLATAPIIPVYHNTAYMSIAQAVVSLIQSVALNPDGDIPVMYISTVGGAAHLSTSNGNMIQYLPENNGIRLFLNPLSLYSQFLLAASNNKYDVKFDFAAMLGNRSGEDIESGEENDELFNPELKLAVLKSLLATVSPEISDGVPMNVGATEKGVDIYFDTEKSITFLSTLMQNLLENKVVADALAAQLPLIQIPGLTPEQLQTILGGIAGYLEKTTKLEVGMSFVKK